MDKKATKKKLSARDASLQFQMMLGRICHRYKKGLPIDRHVEQSLRLLRESSTISPLRLSRIE